MIPDSAKRQQQFVSDDASMSSSEDSPLQGEGMQPERDEEIPPVPADQPPPSGGDKEAGAQSGRQKMVSKSLVFLLPVCSLLFVLCWILLPTLWKSPEAFKGSPSEQANNQGHPAAGLSAGNSLSSQPTAALDAAAGHPSSNVDSEISFCREIWPFSTVEHDRPCHRLVQLQGALEKSNDTPSSNIYPVWIGYLSLKTTSITLPSCKLEPVFRLATDAIRNNSLCGSGYAFLSAYYIHKKIPDRSLSFLEEALALSPKDPWVKLVEALYHLVISQNREQASKTLEALCGHPPVSPVAHYLLAGLYIKKEEYEKAIPSALFLFQEFPEQKHFLLIQKSLFGIQQASYYSTERARGFLTLGKTFVALKDNVMAEHLYQKALKEMSSRFPVEEQKTAYFELGRIYEWRGDQNNAYASYRSALRIDPNFLDARQRIQAILHKPANNS